MASPDFPSAEELQKWTAGLSDAAKTYDPSGGRGSSIEARLKLISLAEDIVRGLTDPSFIGHVYVARVSLSGARPASQSTDTLAPAIVDGVSSDTDTPILESPQLLSF